LDWYRYYRFSGITYGNQKSGDDKDLENNQVTAIVSGSQNLRNPNVSNETIVPGDVVSLTFTHVHKCGMQPADACAKASQRRLDPSIMAVVPGVRALNPAECGKMYPQQILREYFGGYEPGKLWRTNADGSRTISDAVAKDYSPWKTCIDDPNMPELQYQALLLSRFISQVSFTACMTLMQVLGSDAPGDGLSPNQSMYTGLNDVLTAATDGDFMRALKKRATIRRPLPLRQNALDKRLVYALMKTFGMLETAPNQDSGMGRTWFLDLIMGRVYASVIPPDDYELTAEIRFGSWGTILSDTGTRATDTPSVSEFCAQAVRDVERIPEPTATRKVNRMAGMFRRLPSDVFALMYNSWKLFLQNAVGIARETYPIVTHINPSDALGVQA